jgi:uncharacterized protein (TIGR03435 family)
MRTLLLTGLIAACGAIAQTPPAFEAASVKPNRSGSGSSHTRTRTANLGITNVPLSRIITMAYSLRDYQLAGPDWLRSERFDITAKAPLGTVDAQLMPMLRTLLAERFKLETHRETKSFPVYGLVATKGFHLQPVDAAGGSGMDSNNDEKGGELKAQRTPMTRLAEWIAGRVDRPVLDMTGLTGAYDFSLKFSLESEKNDSDMPRYPVIPLALQEQLGLRLEKRTAPIEILVVDRAEKVPIEN